MSDLPPAPDVTLLFGPLLIGVLLNTLLYGIMLIQAFIYYQRYNSDRAWFRYLVLYLVIAETANWICDIGLIYEPLIIRYATAEALTTSPLLLRADGILTVLISTPVQLFIAWRVRVITRSAILPAVISILAIVSLGGGISVTAVVSMHPDYASFPSFKAEVTTWLVSTSACDVFLTSSLVYSLVCIWIRKTRVVATDSYINKIIRLTVQTGLITAAAACLDLALFIALSNTTLNFMSDFPLSKLYTNSLISTLNARAWREDTSDYNAPNVLFEQTPRRNSFSLSATRPSVYISPTHGTQTGSMADDRSKFTLDVEPDQGIASAEHQKSQEVTRRRGNGRFKALRIEKLMKLEM
ncbi:hypothetical protein B0H17DRAFT_1329994 [Mycena rosella]|uniref:DUF6534 domain-containing protein n=1 Tax=Mycena rosella TaxID=1033263 RepID=A0AAD7DL72_MYCRO|nr:hypothetical protein B0H17DRAFT_1329994 [Mycena rosella]